MNVIFNRRKIIMEFTEKVVIVTGGANGIGKGIASAFAKNGAKVVIADVAEEAGKHTSTEINQNGGEAIFIKTDVRIEANIIRLMEAVYESYGRIDILINNAGKGLFKSLYDVTVEEWDDIINTNLRSVFLCSREAAKWMRKNKSGGSIVNIASTRALMSEPNSEGYAATKGGIVAITHALAASLSEERITVNAISPGWIHNGAESKLTAIDHQQHFSNVSERQSISQMPVYT